MQCKVRAQKANSKLKSKIEKISTTGINKDSDCSVLNEKVAFLTQLLNEEELVISELQEECNERSVSASCNDHINVKTKNRDGNYSDDVRLCVIQLAGLK